jgi:hypothetical protein
MPRVLEETTRPEIDRDHIVRRVDDWVGRINSLYGQIEEWLPAGWTAHRKTTVRMHEELMRRLNVPARDLPVLDLLHQGKLSARIEPRGLWIIGANGRLDLIIDSRHYVIIDSAENLEAPQWQIAPLSNRQSLQKLDRETFISVL